VLGRLLSATVRTAQDLAEASAREIGRAEQLAMRLLQSRLEAAQPPALAPGEQARRDLAGPTDGALTEQMDRLLARAVAQSTNGGRLQLFESLVGQLVPDEARILAALSDGRSAAVVHVTPRGSRGGAGLQNASSVGRTAGVALPHLVATYVTHLRQLGLVELGPPDPELELDYELLMAETVVREALAQRSGRRQPRVVRETVRLSSLGRDLWTASRGETASAAS